MKKIILLTILFAGILQASAQEVLVGKDDVVTVNGKRLFKVSKTKSGNMVTESMPEFTVYDMQDVPRLKYDENSKLYFLDDNESFIPGVSSAFAKSLAKFIASDSIFNEKGYNATYKKAFIEKNKGYLHSNREKTYDQNGLLVRDKKIPPYYMKNDIVQDGFFIGAYTVGVYKMEYSNDKKEVICVASYGSKPVNSVWEVKLFFPKTNLEKTMTVYNVYKLKDNILTYLVDNNYL